MNDSNPTSATRGAPPAPSVRESVGRFVLTWAIVLALIAIALMVAKSVLPADWFLSDAEKTTIVKSLAGKMPAIVSTQFRLLHIEIEGTFPAPMLVYEGSSAIVLDETAPEYDGGSHLFGRVPLFRQDVLAVTSGGHYFSVRYALMMSDLTECSKAPAICVLRESMQQLSKDEAKAAFFRSPSFTPEIYQRLFGEAPPARKVAA